MNAHWSRYTDTASGPLWQSRQGFRWYRGNDLQLELLDLLADAALFHFVQQRLVTHSEKVRRFAAIPSEAIERLLNCRALCLHRRLAREFWQADRSRRSCGFCDDVLFAVSVRPGRFRNRHGDCGRRCRGRHWCRRRRMHGRRNCRGCRRYRRLRDGQRRGRCGICGHGACALQLGEHQRLILENDKPLDDVLELTDVTRPAVLEERVAQRVRRLS